MIKQNTYLQMTVITAIIGIVLYFAKMLSFSWGNIVILNNGATINDLWYYNLSAYSDACLMGSFAYFTTWICNMYSDSILLFILKYASITLACIFSVRGVVHIITYNRVSIFEMLADLLFMIYVGYRAVKWHKTHISNGQQHPTDRCIMENH